MPATDSMKRAADTIEQQAALIEQLTTAAGTHASVIAIDRAKGVAVLSDGNNIFEANFDSQIKLVIGSTAVIDGNSGAILRVSDYPIKSGALVTVRVGGKPNSLVEIAGEVGSSLVSSGLFALGEGDRVLLDRSGSVVVHRANPPKIAERSSPGVEWSSVGGQEQAKQELIEAVEHPRKYPALYQKYGKRPTKGVLLYGPTGCGKTLLGKAVATSLSKKSSTDGFLFVKGPEILDPYVGVAEANVRDIFTRAREYEGRTNEAAVIFIDEAESILGCRRGQSRNGMEKTIVPQFLTLMDGIDESKTLVILATNLPGQIDSAILRDSRIDRKIHVGRPSQRDAGEILSLYLDKIPFAAGQSKESCASRAISEIFDASKAYYRTTFAGGDADVFGLKNLVSGALIEGVVEKATASAIRRDIANNRVGGMIEDDLVGAVKVVYEQNRDTNHDEALEYFYGDRKIAQLEKVKNAA